MAWLLTLVLLAGVSGGAAAQPAPEDDKVAQAREHYQKGQAAYDAGRYDEAIAEWEKSYELSSRPLLLFNLGQSARLKEDCKRALAYYKAYLRADPGAENRAEAEGFIREMERCLRAQPPVEQPKVPPAVPVTPAVQPPVLEDVPAHPGRTKRWIGISLMGAGALLAATGLYFGTKAESAASDVSAACRSAAGCEWSQLASMEATGERAETIQWVLYGVGGAAVVGGALTCYLGMRDRSDAAAKVAVAPQRGGAVIVVAAKW